MDVHLQFGLDEVAHSVKKFSLLISSRWNCMVSVIQILINEYQNSGTGV